MKVKICILLFLIILLVPTVNAASSPFVCATEGLFNNLFANSNITGSIYAQDFLYQNGTSCCGGGSGSGDITEVNTNGKYLYGGATSGAVNLLFNETELNTTAKTVKVDNATHSDSSSSLTGTITESQISDLSPHTNRSDADINSVINGSIWNITGSNIFPSEISGNVGIGTTGPGAELEVAGNISVGTYNVGSNRYIGLQGTDDVYDVAHIRVGSFSDGGGYSNDIGFVTQHYGSASAERMTIDKDGNVGIGTTSPSTKLHIHGDAGSDVLNISNGTAGMYMDNDGRVGIGTTGLFSSTTTWLHIADNLPGHMAYITISGDDGEGDGGSGLNLAYDDTTKWSLKTRNKAPAHSLQFYNGSGVSKMTILQSGNIGIGQTSPNVSLSVSGDVNVTGTYYGDGSGITGITADGDGTGGWTNTSKQTSTSLNVSVDSGTLYVDSTNNSVGIGTTGPNEKLHIGGNVWMDSGKYIKFKRSVNNEYGYIYHDGNDFTIHAGSWSGTDITLSGQGEFKFGFDTIAFTPSVSGIIKAEASSGSNLDLRANHNIVVDVRRGGGSSAGAFIIQSTLGIGEIARFDQDGNVGIGTTSPSDELVVNGTFRVLNETGTEGLFVGQNGNVGIGTTNPQEKLTVVGDANITGGLNVSNGLIVNSGNVGIGTTGPESKFHISEDGTATGGSFLSGTTPTILATGDGQNIIQTIAMTSWSAPERPILQFRRGRNTIDAPTAVIENDLLGSVSAGGYDGNSMVFPTQIDFIVDGTVSDESVPARISFLTGTVSGNRTERMVVKSDGNVGIGTTSPSYPLEVATNVSGISIYADGNVSAKDYITRTSVYDKSKGTALSYIKDSNDYKTEDKIDHTKFYGYTTYEKTDLSRPEIKYYEAVDYDKPVYINISTQQCEDELVYETVCNDVTNTECDYELNGQYYDYVCINITSEQCFQQVKQTCTPYTEEECRYESVENQTYYDKICENIEKQSCEDITMQVCSDVITTETTYPFNKTMNTTTYPYKIQEEGVSLNAEIDLLRQAVYELKTELCKKDNSYGWC